VTTAGAVLCWGANANGQIGDGTTTEHVTPVPVIGLGSAAGAIAAGQWHTCALTSIGAVKCWGYNLNGGLGDGTTAERHSPVTATGFDPVLPAFSDDPLSSRVTPVKAAHITQLRGAIASLRARFGLSVVAWTDPTMTARVTVVRAVHFQELRTALAAVYVAAGRSAPTWSPPTIVAGQTIITAASVQDLRDAIVAIW
jgi:hypothetical protein